MEPLPRIKIAIQKSGRLTDNSLDMLVRCGLKYAAGKDRLILYGENLPIDVLLVRDDDIPDLVREDVCDLGIVGRNVLEEKQLAWAANGHATELAVEQSMDYGCCRLSIAVPEGTPFDGLQSLAGKRIATTYPHLLRRFLDTEGIRAQIVRFGGAVEIAPNLGKADFICDLVSTGGTLVANRLWEATTVLTSNAVLVRTPKPIARFSNAWCCAVSPTKMNVLAETIVILTNLPSPKNHAMAGAIAATLPASSKPTATLIQNSVLICLWLIRARCTVGIDRPMSLKIPAKLTNTTVMATRPKSTGVSRRARIEIDARFRANFEACEARSITPPRTERLRRLSACGSVAKWSVGGRRRREAPNRSSPGAVRAGGGATAACWASASITS